MPLSSRGPGPLPFTEETGIQIPPGVQRSVLTALDGTRTHISKTLVPKTNTSTNCVTRARECQEPDLNWWPMVFQTTTLPTELSWLCLEEDSNLYTSLEVINFESIVSTFSPSRPLG